MALVAFPAAQRAEPAAAGGNVEHLVVGMAASLSGGGWQAEQFRCFLRWHNGGRDGGPLLPLLLDHQAHWFRSHGTVAANVGECLAFASVPAWDGFPGGLLVLAGLYPASAPQILRDMRNGGWMAMSIRGWEHSLPGAPGDLWLKEVSLVSKIGDQVDPAALVFGTGREALAVWETLTGSAAGPW